VSHILYIICILYAPPDLFASSRGVFCSQAGQHDFDGKLQDLSPDAFELRQEHNEAVLRTARSLLASTEDSTDRLHLQLLVQNIQDEQRGFELKCHLCPVNSIGYGGVHNNFIEALDWLGERDKVANFLSRLSAFPRQCAQYQELLLRGVEQRCVASAAMVRGVPGQLRDLLAALDGGSGPVCSLLSLVPPEQQAEATHKKGLFRAAIADLLVFFESAYLPHCRAASGCSGVLGGPERGAEVYAHCLRFHTTTSLSAEEIHALGLQEVDRIGRRFRADVMDPLGATDSSSSFASFVQQQCQAPESGQFYSKTQHMMEGYEVGASKQPTTKCDD
jgi:uncharacterized protein (DUF885 family)